MTVVPDTNVIVAALVANGLCREVLHRTIRLRVLATSEPLLQELHDTLKRKFVMTPSVITFLKSFQKAVRIVGCSPLRAPVCRDSADDVVLATAVAAGADVVVTGEQDLLILGSFQGIRIVSPRRLLEELDQAVAGEE